jgi:hypothetical protein
LSRARNAPETKISAAKTSKILGGWVKSHVGNPFPTEDEMAQLMIDTGLPLKRLRERLACRRSKMKRRREAKAALVDEAETTSSGAAEGTLRTAGQKRRWMAYNGRDRYWATAQDSASEGDGWE